MQREMMVHVAATLNTGICEWEDEENIDTTGLEMPQEEFQDQFAIINVQESVQPIWERLH